MSKKVSTGLKSIFIIAIAVLVIYIFGFGAITKFIFKKVLFTPYNIVGIIMTIAAIFGGYINKRQGHWLLKVLTIISAIISLFSIICTILSWFNIDLLNLIWINLLKPIFVSIGNVLLWILISIVAILLLCFIIYIVIKLIGWIKEEIKLKEKHKVYQGQRELVNNIAKQNNLDINFKDELIQNKEQHNKDIHKINLSFPQKEIQDSQKEIKQPKKEKDESKIEIKEPKKQIEKPTIEIENPKIHKIIDLPSDYELKISNNICPVCGWLLKKRINKKTGEQFRGCSNYGYHNCTFTMSDEEYLRIYKKYNFS